MADGETELHLLVRDGNLSKVNEHVNSHGATTINTATGDSEDTALHYAAAIGDSKILHLLLMAGADPNKSNADGQRPLSITVQAGNIASAVILISFGGRLSLTDLQAADPIYHVTQQVPRRKKKKMISMLRRRFAIVESRSPSIVLKRNVRDFVGPDGTINLVSGMDWAIRKRNHIIFYYLLDIKPGLIDKPSEDSMMPLHNAVETGQAELVKYLLDRGANQNAATKYGWTSLHFAANHGHEGIVEMLLSAGADKDVKTTRHHYTPRDLALRRGHEKIAEKLRSKIETGQKRTRRETTEQGSSAPADTFGGDDSDVSFKEAGIADGAVLMDKPYQKPKILSKTIRRIRETANEHLHWKTRSRRIKVAVLDTGIDEESLSVNAKNDSRIAGRKDFVTNCEDDVKDKDGHGTQVAGLIMDIAPHTDLFIARVCVGGGSAENNNAESSIFDSTIKEGAVEKAIQWAILQKVDIINLSLGFRQRSTSIGAALQTANDANILVFAAMNNEGNHEGARWPARDISLAIGIHGSRPNGIEACSYAGLPVKDNPNFMVRGEDIQTHWLDGRFQVAQGSSYATPIAVSMAAVILLFTHQKTPKPQKGDTVAPKKLQIPGKERLKERMVMIRLLKLVSKPSRDEKFLWIHPALLWTDVEAGSPKGGEAACRKACEVIRRAMSGDRLSGQTGYLPR